MVMTRKELEKEFGLQILQVPKTDLNGITFVVKSPNGDVWNFITDGDIADKKEIIKGYKEWSEMITKNATYVLLWDDFKRILFTSTEDYEALAKVVEEAFK